MFLCNIILTPKIIGHQAIHTNYCKTKINQDEYIVKGSNRIDVYMYSVI